MSLNLTLYLGETEYGLQTIDLATMTELFCLSPTQDMLGG